MTLIALDIPDDPAALPGWLERHLVGLDLSALVAELEAAHGPSSRSGATLRSILGPALGAMLDSGLSALPAPALGQLLRHPRLLLELQELVLLEGRDHWSRLEPDATDLDSLIERGRLHLAPQEAAPALQAPRPSPAPAPAPPQVTLTLPTPWQRRPGFVALATAAALLAMFVGWDRLIRPGPPSAWGWNRPGAIAQELPPAVYLDRLADAAEEWRNRRPDDAPSLARRIGEFRQGCSALILAPHKPLSPADRTWLVDRCRAWASKLDADLAALESGSDPIPVRTLVDQTVNSLAKALRDRAKIAT